MRIAWLTYAALLALAVTVTADEKGRTQSGLQPGDSAGAFNVLDCTGPAKGTKLCYR